MGFFYLYGKIRAMAQRHMRYRRLYFFPMLLPLAELVPWLLSLIAAVAGLSGFFNGPFWARWRVAILSAGIVALLAAGGSYAYIHKKPAIAEDGTKTVLAEHYPTPLHFADATARPISTPKDFTKLWSVATQKQILSAPVIYGDALLYGSYEGSVEAVSINNGAPLWSLPLTDFVFSLTKGEDSIIYASEGLHYSEDSGFTALHAVDGTVLWQRRFYGHLEEAAAHNGTKIWLGTGPGGLWSLNAKDASVLWHAKIGHIDSEPLLANNRLYVPAQEDTKNAVAQLYALDADSGKIAWQLPLKGQPWGSPVLDKTGSLILNSSGMGQIGVTRKTDTGWAQGVSLDGKLVWEVPLPNMAIQPASYVADANIVIHATKSGDVIALDAATGKTAWQVKVGNDLQAAPALYKKGDQWLLAVTSADGQFALLDALTGHDIKRMLVAKSSTSSPIMADDTLYILTAHQIQAYSLP